VEATASQLQRPRLRKAGSRFDGKRERNQSTSRSTSSGIDSYLDVLVGPLAEQLDLGESSHGEENLAVRVTVTRECRERGERGVSAIRIRGAAAVAAAAAAAIEERESAI